MECRSSKVSTPLVSTRKAFIKQHSPCLLIVSPYVLASFGLSLPMLSYSSCICGSRSMVPGAWCCSLSTSVEKRLMFSASAGVSSYSDFGCTMRWMPFAEDDCCFNAAACFFFCSSISASDAAIAALSSGSSSSSCC